MKFIRKNDEPDELADWKALENTDWQPTYSDLRGDEKKAVVDSLLEEQGHICCYCGRRISHGRSHIDHLIPQSVDPTKALDYNNMLCSCQGYEKSDDEYETRMTPEHCGHARRNELVPVTPLQEDCEFRFRFTGAGEIKPANDDDPEAETTIQLLKLDIDKLNEGRRDAISGITRNIIGLEPEEKSILLDRFSRRDEEGRFPQFCSAILHVLRHYY